jgi:HAMP domain-containing protein
MQPTVQSEQDKMVPIDTSGDPVEIEVKEDDKKEGEVQVEQEPQVETKEEKKEEELEEYSQSVKRRIDKLTRKMREAERREQAAIEYAKQIQEENKNLKTTSVNTSRERVTSDEASITSTETLLNTALKQAVEQGDVDKQVEAQQKIAELAIEKERLRLRKNRLEQQTAQQPDQTVEQAIDAQPQPQAQPDPKAQEWASDNKWFGTDKAMTYTAMSFHDDLIAEGFDATTDEYYNEIDRRIRKEFPQKFEDQSKPKQTVASAVRKSASGRRTVKLTPSQVAIAKKLGVPLEEYAKHVKEA